MTIHGTIDWWRSQDDYELASRLRDERMKRGEGCLACGGPLPDRRPLRDWCSPDCAVEGETDERFMMRVFGAVVR